MEKNDTSRYVEMKIIFQNYSDMNDVINLSGISKEKGILIEGSGVNLKDYPYKIEPKGTPTVVMASRLLRNKGLDEFWRGV